MTVPELVNDLNGWSNSKGQVFQRCLNLVTTRYLE